MSFLKKPFNKLKNIHKNDSVEKEGPSTPKADSGNSSTNGAAEAAAQNGATGADGARTPPEKRRQSKEVIREEKARRSMDKERVKIEAMKRAQLARIESENFIRTGPPDLTKLYKPYSMNMSKSWNHEHRVLFKDLDFESWYSYLFYPAKTNFFQKWRAR